MPEAVAFAITSRELEILNLSARRFNSKKMSRQLKIAYETIVTRRKKILMKTKSSNVPEAVAFAINLSYLYTGL